MKAKSKKTDKKSGSAGYSGSAGIRTAAAAAGAAAIRSSDCSASRATLPAAASVDPNLIPTAAGSQTVADPKESEKNNYTCSKSSVVDDEDFSLKNENPERGDDMMSLKCKKSGSKSSTDTWIVCESKNIPSPSDGVGTVSSDSKATMQPPLKKMKLEKVCLPFLSVEVVEMRNNH